MASGAAWQLHRSGYRPLIIETEAPTCVRRLAAYASAVYEQKITIAGITGRLAGDFSQAMRIARNGEIPVLVDRNGSTLKEHPPLILVEATMSKGKMATTLDDAELVISLGPGFTAGVDAHVVIETHREGKLGELLYSGSALPNTGLPGAVMGYREERLLRAPAGGVFQQAKEIGDIVTAGETVGFVGNTPVITKIGGTVRGLLKHGLPVHQGMKLGDIHPAADSKVPSEITDKARLVGKGVLTAIRAWESNRESACGNV